MFRFCSGIRRWFVVVHLEATSTGTMALHLTFNIETNYRFAACPGLTVFVWHETFKCRPPIGLRRDDAASAPEQQISDITQPAARLHTR